IVAAIQRGAKQILGVDVPVTGVPLYTDARHYAAAGIPMVLYGAGPRSVRGAHAHGAHQNPRLQHSGAATTIVAVAGRARARSRGIGRNVIAPNHTHDDTSFRADARLRKQRGFECARDCVFALACSNGIADDDDYLPGLGKWPKAVGRSEACLVIEPIAKHWRG